MSTQIKTALVTGSSSGIGLDIARAFLDSGLTVFATSLPRPTRRDRVATQPAALMQRAR